MFKKFNFSSRIGHKFKKEFKKQIRLFITFTFGFTVAFTWRQTFFDISQTFVQFLLHFKNSTTASIFTSVLITLISVLVIYASSYYLQDNSDGYN